jgi:PhnB protein
MTERITRPAPRLGCPAPYLRVRDAARAIDFYTTAFGAREIVRLVEPGGRVAHAELLFGGADGATVMISDEYPESKIVGPQSLGGTPVAIVLYVDDADGVFARAAALGATVRSRPTDDPFGDRTAKIVDPFGHEWMIATRVEAVTPLEMRSRFDGLMGGGVSDG